MLLANFQVGIDRPFFLIAGPCVIEGETLTQEIAGKLKDITTRLNVPFIFKASYDKANRSSAKSFRGPGIDAGLKVLRGCARQDRRARAHRRTRRHAVRRSRERGRRHADAGVPVPPDQLHRERLLAGQAGQHQEGPVPLALGNAERRRQGALHRQRADHGLRARLLVRLQQSRLRHAFARHHARHGRAGGVRRHALGPTTGRAGREAPAASANTFRCWRARRWPPASPACSWKPIRIRPRR